MPEGRPGVGTLDGAHCMERRTSSVYRLPLAPVVHFAVDCHLALAHEDGSVLVFALKGVRASRTLLSTRRRLPRKEPVGTQTWPVQATRTHALRFEPVFVRERRCHPEKRLNATA